MENNKRKSLKQQLDEIDAEIIAETKRGDLYRARSVNVGTSFGGLTELSMRMMSGNSVWAMMQPVEVIELINQLAASIGCHIAIKPREDFASYRTWKTPTHEESNHLIGWQVPPEVEKFINPPVKNEVLPAPKKITGRKISKPNQGEKDAVAVKEKVNKRKPKSTPGAS